MSPHEAEAPSTAAAVRAIIDTDEHLRTFIHAHLITKGENRREDQFDDDELIKVLELLSSMLVLSKQSSMDEYDKRQAKLESIPWVAIKVFDIPFWRAVLQRMQGKTPAYNSESNRMTDWKGKKKPTQRK